MTRRSVSHTLRLYLLATSQPASSSLLSPQIIYFPPPHSVHLLGKFFLMSNFKLYCL